MAAPRPKPTHLKVVAGNPGKRKINKREPKPKRAIPACPEHLSATAQVAWGRLSVILDGMGLLTVADAAALERLCDCYAEILECRALIERDGRTYTSGDDAKLLVKANPAVAMLGDADRRFKSYLVEFGLTPAARSKVHADDGNEEKSDPLGKFFG